MLVLHTLALTHSEPPFVRSEQVGTTIFYFRGADCIQSLIEQ